jgi:hypothetical protein
VTVHRLRAFQPGTPKAFGGTASELARNELVASAFVSLFAS